MSAVDFAARALAMRASMVQPKIFADLCRLNLPSDVRRVTSIGCAEPGLGSGDYIADSVANAALQEQHPNAVFESGGQTFRLVPDASGAITPEQFGCPQYARGVNAQPYIQAAIRYAEALRVAGFKTAIQFTQEKYEVWVPDRIPSLTVPGAKPWPKEDGENMTGVPIVIRSNIELRAAAGGTELIRKAPGGADPAVFANWPAIADVYGVGTFRGGGFIFIKGATIAPANWDDRAALTLRGKWKLNGGIPRSDAPGIYTTGNKYSLKPDGSGRGWDIYDKGICCESSGRHPGDVRHDELEITGFRGELVYGDGGLNGCYFGKIFRGSESDADAWNWNPYKSGDDLPARAEIDAVYIDKCFRALEGAAPGQSRFGYTRIRDCNFGGTYCGGYFRQDSTGIFPKPSMRYDYLEIDTTEGFAISQLTSVGTVRVIDSNLSLGFDDANFWCSSIERIEFVTDRIGGKTVGIRSVALPKPGGVTLSHDSFVGEIAHLRTDYARTNNLLAYAPFTWNASTYGANLNIGRVSGEATFPPWQSDIGTSGATPGFVPALRDNACKITTYTSVAWNVETTPTPTSLPGYFILLGCTNNGHYTLTLPDMTGKLPDGARIRLLTPGNANQRFSVHYTNTTMSKRQILGINQVSEFEWIRNGWRHVSGGGAISSASASVALQKGGAAIPAGDVCDEVTLTVPGARAGMRVSVTPNTVISGDAQLIGRVTANDTVGIRARNMNLSAALTLAATIYRVELDWPN